MRDRRLQEVYCPFEIRTTLGAAKDKRHLLSCLTAVHSCLFLRPHQSWIGGDEGVESERTPVNILNKGRQ